MKFFTACGQAAVTDFDEDEIKSCVELNNANFDEDFKSDRNFTAKLYQKRSKVANFQYDNFQFIPQLLL